MAFNSFMCIDGKRWTDYNKNAVWKGARGMTAQKPVVVAETNSYIHAVAEFWGETTQEAFKDYIARHYDEGDVIPGLGGIRKIRWQGSGHGKRGGVRVIYYLYDERHPVYLLFAYAKNMQENLSSAEKRLLRDYVERIKAGFRGMEGQ